MKMPQMSVKKQLSYEPKCVSQQSSKVSNSPPALALVHSIISESNENFMDEHCVGSFETSGGVTGALEVGDKDTGAMEVGRPDVGAFEGCEVGKITPWAGAAETGLSLKG